jgi:putative nucleotidyltransferase with HDIG domain
MHRQEKSMPVTLRHHVAAGSLTISERKPLFLQAYLGTCVGVAVYCRKSGIGGMIHLLLPEPVSLTTVKQPEKYASTGVPLLIAALLEKGAQADALVATMAGGALVGPLSEQDLALDIGGRTADTVREYLAGREIEVIRSETGGFFTCCLSLDMATGQCTIEPAGIGKLNAPADIKLPTPAEIKASMDHLLPIPQVALKVLRMIEDQGHAIQKIAEEIRKDQVISARAIQLANSAMFAKRHAIESLDQALIYLGTDQVVKLVISAAVQGYFDQSSSGYSLCKGGLYHHALGCAMVAEALAIKTGKVEPRKAYTAGLLHDIGKVVLDQYVAPAYPLFYRQAMEKNENLLTIERRLLGIDHAEAGRMLAQQWSFPESLAHAIRYHHHPGKEGPFKPLAILVYLADLLLSRFNVGFELERIDTSALAAYLESIDLNLDDFDHLVDLIPDVVLKSMSESAAANA